MARKASAKPSAKSASSSANIGFEAKLWLAADKLRNNMDAAEYKHVVLGLIFLKYISGYFDEHTGLVAEGRRLPGYRSRGQTNTSSLGFSWS